MDKPVFFTVGPSQLYPTVKHHIAEALENDVASISHRGERFMEIYGHTMESVRALVGAPKEFDAFFLTSGTEAMERVIQNCVEKKSGHVVYGAFSGRWMNTAKSLGKTTEDLTVSEGEIPDLSKTGFSPEVELIAVTHNETSTGGMIPFSEIRKLRGRYPDSLIAVDIVSSVPVVKVDWNVVDLVFFSVQKGMGMPAGLAILFVSKRAFAKMNDISARVSIGSFHAFPELKKYADRKQTSETPNVMNIYLLGKVADDMLLRGIDDIRLNIEKRAQKVYDFLESSSNKPFIERVNGRSLTTICATVPGGSKPILEALKTKGLIVGGGYGKNKEAHIRIGNFPAHTDEDFERVREALDNL